jgi:hypothetical protein
METPLKTEQKQNDSVSKCSSKCLAENPPGVVSDKIAWICCDECQNWFHQYYVAIESTDVEGI